MKLCLYKCHEPSLPDILSLNPPGHASIDHPSVSSASNAWHVILPTCGVGCRVWMQVLPDHCRARARTALRADRRGVAQNSEWPLRAYTQTPSG